VTDGASDVARHVQAQGAAFESAFRELLGRVLAELRYTIVENVVVGSGAQGGRDVQTRWRTPDRREFAWFFECKSHDKTPVAEQDIANKLVSIARTRPEIDVWCLVMANREPTVGLNSLLAEASSLLWLTCGVELISPQSHDLRGLFACYPDLFLAVYPNVALTPPSVPMKQRRLRAFDAFLRDATREARERALTSPWTIVIPGAMALRDDPLLARSYLRGWTACPWEAVAFDWAVERPSSANALHERIERAEPGLTVLGVTAAGGEGKTSLLRQLSWQHAQDPTFQVLWAGGEDDVPAHVPARWLEHLPQGARALLVVDGARRLRDVAQLVERQHVFAGADQRLLLLLADRGHEWFGSRVRNSLARRVPGFYEISLTPLAEDERQGLIDKLDEHGLLHVGTRESAFQLLTQAAESAARDRDRSWLLPTMMQLTDREGRAFEKILESVLDDLSDADRTAAYMLLLGSSVAHAAGTRLPYDLAQRICATEGGVGRAQAVLAEELEAEALYLPRGGGRRLQTAFATHHRVVAAALVAVAAEQPAHAPRLRDLCAALPAAVASDVDLDGTMPVAYFDLLRSVAEYLVADDVALYEPAIDLLQGWYDLDHRYFPNVGRLADCLTAYMQDVARRGGSIAELTEIAAAARAAHLEHLRATRIALADPEAVPPRIRRFKLDEAESQTFHAWAVLESAAGQLLDDRLALRRAAYLSFVAILPKGDRDGESRRSREDVLARCCGTLSLNLIHLGLPEHAASVVAAGIAAKMAGEIVRLRRQQLADIGVELPQPALGLLDRAAAELAVDVFAAGWPTSTVFDREDEHLDYLVRAVESFATWLPSATHSSYALEQLRARRAGLAARASD
jgi:hypothetical protein